MPYLLLLHCTGPLPIASACRQGNSGEKKNCSIFAPFNYFSQTLSVLFKHFSQFSSLSRMFPNPRLPLRLLNEDIMLLLFCPLCQSSLTSCAHILFNHIVATVIENSSSSNQGFLEVSGLKRYSATDNLTFNRCGNQRHLKKEASHGGHCAGKSRDGLL